MVALVACGTRALLDAASGPARGKGTGERELARTVLGSLREGMLLLADRGFYSYQLWNQAAATGAHLLWRVTASMHLPVVRELPDGSWLTHINDPAAVTARLRKNGMRRRRGSSLGQDTGPLPGITVRVIEFTITITTADGSTQAGRYRMITSLLDWRAYPAADLATGYGQRWAVEIAYPSSRPTCAAPAGYCAAGPRTWPARNCGPTWSSTRPSAPSSSAPPPAPGWTRTGSPSPPPCTPHAAPSSPPGPAWTPP
jgi:hypothetical protein